MAKAKQHVEVLIEVDEEHRTRLVEIVRKLRSAGLRDIESLDAIGLVRGRIEPAGTAAIRAIPGIVTVSPAGGVSIPPPGAPIQ